MYNDINNKAFVELYVRKGKLIRQFPQKYYLYAEIAFFLS